MSESARVLVTGGRCFRDRLTVNRVLDRIHASRGVSVLIHGASDGADRLAAEWAKANGVAIVARPADWRKHGRAAGPIRNSQMIGERPDVVVAFEGGRGTADMVAKARNAGIEVVVVEPEVPR